MATAEKEIEKQAVPEKSFFTAGHPFSKICANRVMVVVQQKGGNVIKGQAKWFRSGYLKLMNAEVIGAKNRVKVPWILIENHSIAHLHPEGEAQPVEPSE